MAPAKNGTTNRPAAKISFGLLAVGSSGPWQIDLDETLEGPDRWFAQIEGPSVTFNFEIAAPGLVCKMIRFVEPRSASADTATSAASNGEDTLALGKDKKSPVTLVKDDEFPDRFFLLIGPPDRPLANFTLAGADLAHVAEALRQVQRDLDDET
jgi:hypothetical protein